MSIFTLETTEKHLSSFPAQTGLDDKNEQMWVDAVRTKQKLKTAQSIFVLI